MSNNLPIPPALISVSRIRTLVASLFVSLGSGTNYVSDSSTDSTFNADMNIRNFARSIQVRSAEFHLSCLRHDVVDHLSLFSIFATTGSTAEDVSYAAEHCCACRKWCGISNILAPFLMRFSVGVYSSGPIWGKIVDSRGPRILLACSFVSLLGGYSGIRYLYDSGLAPDALSAPAITFYTLLLCSFLTGIGGAGGITGALNTITKSFPDRAVCSPRFLQSMFYSLIYDREHPQLVW
jgi:MFS family permease